MKFIVKQKKRSAVSPVIATLLLIAIAVAAAIIVYAFVTGLIGGLTTSGGSSLVAVSGTLTVPGGSGAGTLVITVRNSANNPITAATASNDAANPAGFYATYAGTPTGSGPGSPAATVYSGTLPIGQSTSATAAVAGATAGNTYTFTITVYFSGGGSQTQTLSVTAQV